MNRLVAFLRGEVGAESVRQLTFLAVVVMVNLVWWAWVG